MSSFLGFPPAGEIQEEMGPVVEAVMRQFGYVPNYVRLFGLRPEAFAAWRALARAVTSNMDERRYELATVAAARQLRCSYCSLAHGKILAEKFHPQVDVIRMFTGETTDALDEVDRAVIALGEKVAADANTVSEEDVAELRRLGLSDRDIFDVILAAAARCFFSKVLDATGTLPDAAYNELDLEFLEAMTVGRPVASA